MGTYGPGFQPLSQLNGYETQGVALGWYGARRWRFLPGLTGRKILAAVPGRAGLLWCPLFVGTGAVEGGDGDVVEAEVDAELGGVVDEVVEEHDAERF